MDAASSTPPNTSVADLGTVRERDQAGGQVASGHLLDAPVGRLHSQGVGRGYTRPRADLC